MIIVFATLIGIILGICMPYNFTSDNLPYVAIAILAALDSVFGGLSANIKKKFNINIFLVGLFSNAILAVLLTYIGDKLGINISFAAVIVFGTRVFNNLAEIRRSLLDKFVEAKSKKQIIRRTAILAIEGDRDYEENNTNVEDGKDRSVE